MTNTTYRIPAHQLDEFEVHINKLNKRAVRLGVAPIRVSVVGREIVEVRPSSRNRNLGHVNYSIKVLRIQIEGDAPRINGWEFIAVISKGTVDNNIVRVAPEKELPEHYRHNDPHHCDHCEHARDRKYTYVVRNVETGEHKQVGSTCLRDFLGHTDPSKIAEWFNLTVSGEIVNQWELPTGPYYTGPVAEDNAPRYYGVDLQEYLGWVAVTIRTCGWTSRSEAYGSNKAATADLALYLWGDSTRPRYGDYDKRVEPEQVDTETAKAAIEWGKTADGENDYIHNVRVISEVGWVELKDLGVAASIVSSYQRQLEHELVKKAQENHEDSKWVGEVKKRQDWELTVLSSRFFNNDFGGSTLFRFADPEGNILIWWCNNDADLDVGKSYSIKGTVKQHDEYRGTKQTVLSRCKVIGQISKED